MMVYYNIFTGRENIFFAIPFLWQKSGVVVQTVENTGLPKAAHRLPVARPPEDILFGA